MVSYGLHMLTKESVTTPSVLDRDWGEFNQMDSINMSELHLLLKGDDSGLNLLEGEMADGFRRAIR